MQATRRRLALVVLAPACGRTTGACVETNKGTSATGGDYKTCNVKMERECTMDALQAAPPLFFKGQECRSVGYPCKGQGSFGSYWPLEPKKPKDIFVPDFGPCGFERTLEH